MSRYRVSLIDDNAVIGWDEPLRTYFLRSGVQTDADLCAPRLWLGSRPGEYPSLTELLEAAWRHGFRVGVSDAAIAALTAQAAGPRRVCLAERLGLLDGLSKALDERAGRKGGWDAL